MTLIDKSLIEKYKPELEKLISLRPEEFKKYNKRKRGELCEKYIRYWINSTNILNPIKLNHEDFKDYQFNNSKGRLLNKDDKI